MGNPLAAGEKVPPAEQGAVVEAAKGLLSQRLVDSLLHDVRNPLNALSINLDVLVEKLRRDQGEIPEGQQKNLKAMRDQVFRVDAVLKHFAGFMAPRPEEGERVNLSALVAEVVELLGHECRRSMIRVRQLVEPDLVVRADAAALRFLVLQAMFRAVTRAGSEGEVNLTLQRDQAQGVLRVKDGGPPSYEPFPHAGAALQEVAQGARAEVRVAGQECWITLPLC